MKSRKRKRHRVPIVMDNRKVIYDFDRKKDLSLSAEADLGMFSMFGQTGAPQKGNPTKAQKNNISCCNSSVHCSAGPQQNVEDDYCACRVKAVGGGYSYIRGSTFFLNRVPARNKSGHGYRASRIRKHPWAID